MFFQARIKVYGRIFIYMKCICLTKMRSCYSWVPLRSTHLPPPSMPRHVFQVTAAAAAHVPSAVLHTSLCSWFATQWVKHIVVALNYLSLTAREVGCLSSVYPSWDSLHGCSIHTVCLFYKTVTSSYPFVGNRDLV